MGDIEDASTRDETEETAEYDISVVSDVIQLLRPNRRLICNSHEIDIMHWTVIENCVEARPFIDRHETEFYDQFPYSDNDGRITDFHGYFLDVMTALHEEGGYGYSRELHILSYKPQFHTCYAQCYVNGVKYVIQARDENLTTQNSGVMVHAGDIKYYGVLENIIELQYAEGMSVVLFKCKWYNTDPEERGTNFTVEHGLLSIDTLTSWYDDAPYCLATNAQQVFYLEDPTKLEGRWMVVNEIAQRGTYSESSIARGEDDNDIDNVNDAYQEDGILDVPMYMEDDGEYDDYDQMVDIGVGNFDNEEATTHEEQLEVEFLDDIEEVEFDYAQRSPEGVEEYEDESGGD